MMPMVTIADSLNQTTSSELNNANFHGNAEEPEPAKEVDGAVDMMVAKEPHFLNRPQDYSQITDELNSKFNY